jgi:hypothetical protein
VIENSGNGHFTQANRLMDMIRFVPKDALVSVAWDHTQRPVHTTPLNMDRIHQSIDLAGPRISYDPRDGSVDKMNCIYEGLNPIVLYSYIASFWHLRSFIYQENVTNILNLYSASFGCCSRLMELPVPVYNIASQYVHVPSDLMCNHPDASYIDLFVLRFMYSMTQASTPHGAQRLAIVPVSPDTQSGTTSGYISFPTEVPLSSIPEGCKHPVPHRFVLVYMLTTHQSINVFRVARQLSSVSFVYFTEFVPHVLDDVPPNVCIHRIHREAFRWYMQQPGVVVWTTGGYMLPCEAISTGKNLLMTHTLGHFEQYCNTDYFQKEFPHLVRTCPLGTEENRMLMDLLESMETTDKNKD